MQIFSYAHTDHYWTFGLQVKTCVFWKGGD